MTFATTSICGDFHATNEDYLLRHSHQSGEGRYLCFLADGQGGRPDGDKASRAACEGAREAALTMSWDELGIPSTWDDIFLAADRRVRETCAGFTTLIGLAIDGESIRGASVGDSAVYYLDSPSGEFTELTGRQVKNPPIGSGCPVTTPFYLTAFEGSLLVVTDGVWKYTDWDTLKIAAREDPEKIADHLLRVVQERNANRLPDDFSVIACSRSI